MMVQTFAWQITARMQLVLSWISPAGQSRILVQYLCFTNTVGSMNEFSIVMSSFRSVYIDESFHTYEGVVSHVWMRISIYICVMYINASCHTCDMSHMSHIHVSYMNESFHTRESYVTHIINESHLVYECIMTHI